MGKMYDLLRGTCLFCHKFKIGRADVRIYSPDMLGVTNSLFCLQLVKTIAKLRLLDAGLLHAAQLVDDMQIKARAVDEDAVDAEDAAIEDIDAFAMRVELWVQSYLRSASSSKRDNYKDGLVYQERKAVIHEFIRAAQRRKCSQPSCGA